MPIEYKAIIPHSTNLKGQFMSAIAPDIPHVLFQGVPHFLSGKSAQVAERLGAVPGGEMGELEKTEFYLSLEVAELPIWRVLWRVS